MVSASSNRPFAYLDLVDVLCDGPPGMGVLDTLNDRFPSLSRDDVYMGVATAWSLLVADLVVERQENERLRRTLERAQRASC